MYSDDYRQKHTEANNFEFIEIDPTVFATWIGKKKQQ